VADRDIFQDDQAEFEDQDFCGEFAQGTDDPDLDSIIKRRK